MFQVGEAVFYGMNGVCMVNGIEELVFSGKKDKYYILNPISGSGSTYFVPLSSEILIGKMRKLLTASEIDAILDKASDNPIKWEENDKKRKLVYKEALSSGEVCRMISLLDSVYMQKMKTERGKKGRVLALDENFLRDAGRVVCEEFSYVLDIAQPEVITRLISRLAVENA